MTKVKHGDTVKEKILKAGLKLWRKNPEKVTAREIGRVLDLTHAAVLYHYPGAALKNAIADYAVGFGDSRVIVQLIATNHPAIADMSKKERNIHMGLVKNK